MNDVYWNDGTYLYHHGIPGQKWGVQNGPPYPLNADDHSKREKKREYQDTFYKKRIDKKVRRKSIDREAAIKETKYDKRHFADKQSMEIGRSPKSNKTGLSNSTKALLAIAGVTVAAATIRQLSNKGKGYVNYNYNDPFESFYDGSDKDINDWIDDLYDNNVISNNSMISSAKDAYNKLWSDKWYDEISNEEYSGIVNYTGNWYKDMNMYLRTGDLDSIKEHNTKDVLQLIDQATSALQKASLPNDAIVHRGVGSLSALAKTLGVPPELLTLGNGNNPKDLIGMDFVDKAFGSTGAVPDAAWGGCKLHICLPKGSQAMFVAPISEYPGEKEVLVNRGAHYVIKDLKMDSFGNVSDLVVELIDHIN